MNFNDPKAKVVRQKIEVSRLPDKDFAEKLKEVWKYNEKDFNLVGERGIYYTSKDWKYTKTYVKEVASNGEDIKRPITNTRPIFSPKKKENYKAI